MHDVFVSYSREEQAKAEAIKRLLEERGYSVFFDVKSIEAGSEYPDAIDAALKSAKAVVACWSPLAFRSSWVKRECRVARARGVLIPVAIAAFEELEIPTEFFGVDYVDLRDIGTSAGGRHWEKLERRLSYLSREEAVVERPLSVPPPQIKAGYYIGTSEVFDCSLDSGSLAAFASELFRGLNLQAHAMDDYLVLSNAVHVLESSVIVRRTDNERLLALAQSHLCGRNVLAMHGNRGTGSVSAIVTPQRTCSKSGSEKCYIW